MKLGAFAHDGDPFTDEMKSDGTFSASRLDNII